MGAITILDLNNAKSDVDHIAALANVTDTTAVTATDRLGQQKMTMMGAVATIKAFNERGDWVGPGTTYAAKDLVLESGTWYVCVTPHMSSANFATDESKWRIYQGTVPSEVPYTVATYSALRSYAGDAFAVNVSGYLITAAPQGIAGLFTRDDSDTTTADNGGTVIVAANGKRWKRVFDGDINILWFGLAMNGVTDDTVRAQAALAAAAGKGIFFPDGDYYLGALQPASNTKITMSPGVTITKPVGRGYILYLNNKSDIYVYCNGATLIDEAADAAASNTVMLLGCVRCHIYDPNIRAGSRSGFDGIYLGVGTDACFDCVVRGGSVKNAKRNNISLVGAKRCTVDGVECSGATGSPGVGIDIEANVYGVNEDNTVQNCHCHHNQNAGIINNFGWRTKLLNNVCHDNGTFGIAASTGGVTFSAGVYRSNVDVRGVSNFDAATGYITVGGDLDTLPVGAPVFFNTSGAGVLPSGLSAQVYQVAEHDATGTKIRVSLVVDSGVITSFGGAASGTLNANPALSEITLTCYGMPGQTSDMLIEGNVCYSNGTNGILASTTRNVRLLNNTCYDNTAEQIKAQYVLGFEASGNVTYQQDNVTNQEGLYASACSYMKLSRHTARGCGAQGVFIQASSYPQVSEVDCHNNGTLAVGTNSAQMGLDTVVGAQLARIVCRQSEDLAVTYGLHTNLTTESSFRDINCKKAGSSNANSFVPGTSPTNSIENVTLNDGAKWGIATTTWDPGSIAAGAELGVNMTVPGAILGDMVTVSLNRSLSNMTISGAVIAADTVRATLHNETGAAVDLASSTLKARIIR